MEKYVIENMTSDEIEKEIEDLKSPFEKLFDKESRKMALMKEKQRRLKLEVSDNKNVLS